jgi:hypothetical protein
MGQGGQRVCHDQFVIPVGKVVCPAKMGDDGIAKFSRMKPGRIGRHTEYAP